MELIGKSNVSEIIEPSAGNGSFSSQIENCIAYDIAPESSNIIEQDFLTLDLPYKSNRLFIGNPPFGARNSLSISFFNKCCEMGDYIAFILPITCYNNIGMFYKFDLDHSEKLGSIKYSNADKEVNTCFNIYKRPTSGKLNKKPKAPRLSGITAKRYDRVKSGKFDHLLEMECDLRLGTYGAGCIGKESPSPGKWSQELLLWIDRDDKQEVIDYILSYNWKGREFSGQPILSQTILHEVLIEKFGE